MDGEGAGQYPLIVFPTRQRGASQDRFGRPPRLTFPTHGRQIARAEPQFKNLQDRFNAALQVAPDGVESDLVLVIEIAGRVVDFVNATRYVEGLKWIGEWDTEDIDPSLDFATSNEGQRVAGTLFLMFSNQSAMRELLSLWDRYKENPAAQFRRGLNKWRDVFKQLHTIRLWDEQDRVTDELVKDWRLRLEGGLNVVPFEAELWYSQNEDKRRKAEAELRAAVEDAGGRVAGHYVISEIDYQVAVGELPSDVVRNMQGDRAASIFKNPGVMYLRPAAQALVSSDEGDFIPTEDAATRPLPDNSKEAVVAILDGLPVGNHPLLSDRLIIDDPDGWAATVAASDRVHGTAMASLVVHGDLGARESPLTRPVYIRPILMPDPADWRNDPRVECVPEGVPFADIVRRSVERLFDESLPGVGRIFVINLSVGDLSRMFLRSISPCARLLDWLAWKYKVLFLVSAGNHVQDVDLDITRDSLAILPALDVESQLIRGLERQTLDRRLLSPAEAVNALTVGSAHRDSSEPLPLERQVLAFQDVLPSPFNAHGFGYRRAIKPDVLFDGGRILLEEANVQEPGRTRVRMVRALRPPGNRVAAPPPRGTGLVASRESHIRGTSNACAFATRNAAFLYELLSNQRMVEGSVPNGYMAVALKTLSVHGAEWGTLGERYIEALAAEPSVLPPFVKQREYVAKYLGNGIADFSRSVLCNSRRITLIGYGSLTDGEADVYTFPLPLALSGRRGMRKLVVTLSWLSQMNPRHNNYRRAHLWFNFPAEDAKPGLAVSSARAEVHNRPAQRGTLQHEIFVGDEARVLKPESSILISVNCKADAGSFEDKAPYCLAVTMEVGEELDLPIYQQVAERVRQAVQVQP
ncbi:MAG TPA: S8 family peptidase [Candidatus Dormibacteraeota bacterium]|nr:S8 family peptidase [Candidatus Dormibacteraeota bacterium]